MGTAMAVYVEETGSPFAASMVLAAYFVGMTFAAPFWGAIADATGRHRLVLIATSGLSTVAVLPLVFLGDDYVWSPIGIRALYAVFAAGFPPVMLAIVSERGGATGRGRSLGFYNSARAVGFAGGQIFVGVLLGLLGASELYLVVAFLSLGATLIAVFVDDNVGNLEPSGASLGEVGTEVRSRLLPASGEREHLKTNGLSWLYFALALRNMTVLGVMSLAAPFLLREVGVTEFILGVILAINPVGQTLFMYLFGRVADSWGRKPLITTGMAGSGAFALVAAASTVPEMPLLRKGVAGIAFVLIAASFSALTTGALAFIGDVSPPRHESELMGLRSTAKGVGGVLGPLVVGAIATLVSYEAAFVVGSTFAFVGAAIVLRTLVETYPAESESEETGKRAPGTIGETGDD